MPTIYVQCKFRPNDARTYTYAWDGEPLNKGDIVRVPDKIGTGWQRVTVESISDEAPPYKCKQILGLFNPDVEPNPTAEPNNSDIFGRDHSFADHERKVED